MDAKVPPIAWVDALSIGDETIDEEHRSFIVAINELIHLLEQRAGRRAIIAHLAAMLHDAAGHFASEEAALRRYGVESLAIHESEHTRILQVIHDLLRRAGDSAADDLVEQHALSIRDQLLAHFLRVDLQYKSHILQSQGR
jgi:hemerythrin-like metal-binding protein